MLSLGNSLSKKTGVVAPGVIKDNLLMEHKYSVESVKPISNGAAYFGAHTLNEHIELGTTGLYPNSITISVWVNHGGSNQSQGYARIIDADGDGLSWHLRFDNSSNRFVGKFSANGTDFELCQSDSSYGNYSKWYHVAVNYNASSGTCKMYVDGVHDGTDTGAITGNLNVPTTPVIRIGQEPNSVNNNFEGYICNVGVWGRVLTQAEIKSIMFKQYADLSDDEKSSLVSWWNLDEETNTSGESGTGGVKDHHGSNHGTLS
tara:strand:+ start:401 stop:1180 length:780 start_codon:yes stop_codon:yes gene_type:complete